MLRFEDTDWDRGYRVQSLPARDRRTDPLGQNIQQSSYQRAHHLQNFHNSGYETSTTATNYDPFSQDHHRRQHFVKGVIPGGSKSNKMMYGTEDLLWQSEEKRKIKSEKPDGFLYGTEAATNVGKQKATTKPNNALWIEARVNDDHVTRHQKLAKDQGDFLYMHNLEREKQKRERQQEKKRDLEMLQTHFPFGKPGHGAPNKGPDPNKFEARRTNQVKALQEEAYTPLGLGGGGAPNRTVSGKQQTKLRADPELRFPKHGENSNIAEGLRYNKKDKEYGTELERFMEEMHSRRQQEEQQRKEQELHHIRQNPYQKPGGGAPMVDEKGRVKTYFPKTLSKDDRELRLVEPRHQHAYNDPGKSKPDDYAWLDPHGDHWPWGKGYQGIVERDRAGKIIKTTRPKTDDTEGIGIPVGRPGAGAPIKDNDGKIRTRKAQTLTKNNYGQVMSREFSPKERSEYYPFKRPGAGAPITDADGKVKTHLVAQVERMDKSPTSSFKDIQAKQAYLKTLQDQADLAEYKRKEESEDLKKSGGDVSSWIRSGQVGQPKFDPVTKEIVASHKTTSDVTQQKLNIRRQKNDTSSNYHHDLQVLIDAKQKQRYHEKESEKHDSIRHVETMNNQWGRKGGGAPLDGYRKQKSGLDPFDEISFRPT